MRKSTPKLELSPCFFYIKMAPSPISLKTLIDADFLTPGPNVLQIKINRKKVIEYASLTDEGFIVFNNNQYHSPSDWSLHAKNIHNPTLTSDRGWTSIIYQGSTLNVIRSSYVSRRDRLQKLLIRQLLLRENIDDLISDTRDRLDAY